MRQWCVTPASGWFLRKGKKGNWSRLTCWHSRPSAWINPPAAASGLVVHAMTTCALHKSRIRRQDFWLLLNFVTFSSLPQSRYLLSRQDCEISWGSLWLQQQTGPPQGWDQGVIAFEPRGTFSTQHFTVPAGNGRGQELWAGSIWVRGFLNINDGERDWENYHSQTNQLLRLLEGSTLGDPLNPGAGS